MWRYDQIYGTNLKLRLDQDGSAGIAMLLSLGDICGSSDAFGMSRSGESISRKGESIGELTI